MRIALFSSTLDVKNGYGNFTYEFCSELAQRKEIDFTLFLPVSERKHSLPSYTFRVEYVLPDYIFRIKPYNFLPYLGTFSLAGYDLVHSLLDFPYCFMAARIAKKNHLPFIMGAQGTYGVVPLTYFPEKYLLRWSYTQAKKTIVPSVFTKEKIEEYAQQKYPIEIIHNGVNFEKFQFFNGNIFSSLKEKYKDKIVLLTVGGLKQRKGQDLVLKALSQVISEVPNIQYVIVGDGSWGEYLKQLAKELKVDSHVEFVGQVNDDDLISYFHTCDIYIHTPRCVNLNFEGFGIVYLEAGACKKPIIATDAGGIRDAVIDGKTGRVVPDEDIEGIAQAIGELAMSVELRENFGENGYVYAQEHTWKKIIDSFIQVYNQVIPHNSMNGAEDNKSIYVAYADKILDKRYNSSNLLRRHAHRSQYESVIRQVPVGSRVIDIGCGEGVLSCLLAEKGFTVTGIDISEPNIIAAKELAKRMGVEDRVTFMQGDAENVPFPDKSFDVAVSCHVLEHLPDFEKGKQEVFRVARDRAIIALPTITNPCSLIQAGRGSFWEVSKRSLLALPVGFIKSLFHIFGEGVDEGYGGNKELTHIWRYPWIMRKRLQHPDFTLTKFEASSFTLPYWQGFVPFIKKIEKARDWKFWRNFGYGSTAVLERKKV